MAYANHTGIGLVQVQEMNQQNGKQWVIVMFLSLSRSSLNIFVQYIRTHSPGPVPVLCEQAINRVLTRGELWGLHWWCGPSPGLLGQCGPSVRPFAEGCGTRLSTTSIPSLLNISLGATSTSSISFSSTENKKFRLVNRKYVSSSAEKKKKKITKCT